MPEDPRTCGTIACIINAEGRCWCGLQWDGEKMVRAPIEPIPAHPAAKSAPVAAKPRRKTPARKTRTAR
jgi:hypothetical protein